MVSPDTPTTRRVTAYCDICKIMSYHTVRITESPKDLSCPRPHEKMACMVCEKEALS